MDEKWLEEIMDRSKCYVCRKPFVYSNMDDPMYPHCCQDCGEDYCEACFHTTCHDLCIGDEMFHYTKECPHYASLFKKE